MDIHLREMETEVEKIEVCFPVVKGRRHPLASASTVYERLLWSFQSVAEFAQSESLEPQSDGYQMVNCGSRRQIPPMNCWKNSSRPPEPMRGFMLF
jgi:hypothetical protein